MYWAVIAVLCHTCFRSGRGLLVPLVLVIKTRVRHVTGTCVDMVVYRPPIKITATLFPAESRANRSSVRYVPLTRHLNIYSVHQDEILFNDGTDTKTRVIVKII